MEMIFENSENERDNDPSAIPFLPTETVSEYTVLVLLRVPTRDACTTKVVAGEEGFVSAAFFTVWTGRR